MYSEHDIKDTTEASERNVALGTQKMRGRSDRLKLVQFFIFARSKLVQLKVT
jgi:hypothetical protein